MINYLSLFVDRGPPGGNMTTDELSIVATNKQTYRLGKYGLEPSHTALFAINLEEQAQYPSRVVQPPHLEITAIWDETPCFSGSSNNILGDNGTLYLAEELLHIPCIEATQETLAYYGALLLHEGDLLHFTDRQYPIFKMTIGHDYVNRFLVTPQGGGFYLEYHDDKPHFHMPIKGEGYYLLAKWSKDKTKLQITGFKIPHGTAVYTKKGAIHCDAALIGSWYVGYDSAEECSTALLRSNENTMAHIEFIDKITF